MAPNNGFLTIVKSATPSDSTNFTFNLGAGQASQNGTSSWTITGSGSVLLISFAPGATYDLTEIIPAGWNLTGVSCAIQTNPATPTGTTVATGVQDFTIQPGLETVCTFTDAKQQGAIKIVKETVGGSSGENYDFVFKPTGFNSDSEFTLTTTGVNGTKESTVFGSLVVGGSYGVVEVSTPTGWSQTGATCTNGTPDNIVVADGATTVCTFTNTRERGFLRLLKVFDGLTSGFNGTFAIKYNCGAGDVTVDLSAGVANAQRLAHSIRGRSAR